MCNCPICKRARRFIDIIKDLPEEDKKFMEEILSDLYSAEETLDWFKHKERIRTMKNHSEIVCIIDRSGSMEPIREDAIGGFNTFLKEQQELSEEASLTYIQFDDKYEVIHENKPLKEVSPLDKNTFVPRGSTALLYAVGKTIDDIGQRLSTTPESNRPSKVIVVILTDGMENASHMIKDGEKYTSEKIKEMITHQKEKYSWEFIYLGANQDAFTEGAKMGIARRDTSNFVADSDGVKAAYCTISNRVTTYRSR